MKAVQIKKYGGTEAIEILETEKPVPKQGQVLVEVHAASLNRIDSYFRQGGLQQWQQIELPATLGGDFAGIVAAVGENVTGFKIGDEVFGNAGVYRGGSGSLADFVISSVDNVNFKPKSLDFNHAAALPLAGVSALQGIEEELKVEKGQKILIQGGAGGIGSLAIQIAKLSGAHVSTTVGADDIEFAKSLGADEVYDYKTQDVSEILKDYDGIFNTANPTETDKLFTILKNGGKFVSMTGQPNQELAKKYAVEIVGQMTTVNNAQLKRLAELVDSGKIKVFVEKTFSFTQTKEAFEYFETQHPKGKVAVEVK